MSNYKDRGIIKWAPYRSLIGFDKMCEELIDSYNNIEKPILSEDQLNLMDYNLKTALKSRLPITFRYFYKNRIYIIKGVIKNIDFDNKQIIIDKYIFDIKDIIELNIL